MEGLIRPALARGATVVCDRYLDSSVAYQGAGRALGVDGVLALNLAVVGGLLPDRTFLIEVDPETAAARVGDVRDRIERAGPGLWERVGDAYHEARRSLPRALRRRGRAAARRGDRDRDP